MSHCTEVGVELLMLFLQEGAHPAVWVDTGPVDALWWVCSSDAKCVIHHLPGLDRIFGICIGPCGTAPGSERGGNLFNGCVTDPNTLPLTPCEVGPAQMRVVSPATAWLNSEDARRWRFQHCSLTEFGFERRFCATSIETTQVNPWESKSEPVCVQGRGSWAMDPVRDGPAVVTLPGLS